MTVEGQHEVQRATLANAVRPSTQRLNNAEARSEELFAVITQRIRRHNMSLETAEQRKGTILTMFRRNLKKWTALDNPTDIADIRWENAETSQPKDRVIIEATSAGAADQLRARGIFRKRIHLTCTSKDAAKPRRPRLPLSAPSAPAFPELPKQRTDNSHMEQTKVTEGSRRGSRSKKHRRSRKNNKRARAQHSLPGTSRAPAQASAGESRPTSLKRKAGKALSQLIQAKSSKPSGDTNPAGLKSERKEASMGSHPSKCPRLSDVAAHGSRLPSKSPSLPVRILGGKGSRREPFELDR